MYEVLEHIELANHFLLRMVSKQKNRALATQGKHVANEKEYGLNNSMLERMKRNGSCMWVPQQYIEPLGEMPLLQLKMSLHDQMKWSLQLLQNQIAIDAIMNTSETRTADALHYLYFLVQHIQRHLGQIERAQRDFDQWQKEIACSNSIVTTKTFCLN